MVHNLIGDKMKYENLVKKHTPKENIAINVIVSFCVGGLLGIIGQFLVDIFSYYLSIPSKEASVFMIVTLIFIGCLLTCLGVFDLLVEKAKCGLIVPITGFAHSMMSTALEYRREGLVTGLGANMFKLAGTVILYGVVSAYVFGLIRFLIIGG